MTLIRNTWCFCLYCCRRCQCLAQQCDMWTSPSLSLWRISEDCCFVNQKPAHCAGYVRAWAKDCHSRKLWAVEMSRTANIWRKGNCDAIQLQLLSSMSTLLRIAASFLPVTSPTTPITPWALLEDYYHSVPICNVEKVCKNLYISVIFFYLYFHLI